MTLRRGLAACLLWTAVSGGTALGQPGPLISKENPKDWRVVATVSIEPDPRAGRAFVGWSVDWVAAGLAHQINSRATTFVRATQQTPGLLDDPDHDPVRWAESLWPVIVRSGSSAMWVDRGVQHEVTSQSAVGDAISGKRLVGLREPLGEEYTGFYSVENGGVSDVLYARAVSWQRVRPGETTDWVPDPITWDTQWRTTTWDTRADEQRLRQLKWPKPDRWPEHAEHWLEGPSARPAEVAALVDDLTRGRAMSQPPYVAAKWVAGEIARRFEPQGDSIEPVVRQNARGRPVPVHGSFEGLDFRDPAEVARTLRGSLFDLPLLVRDAYREMGLPSRVVFGYATGGFDGAKASVRLADETASGLHAWIEVAMLDTRRFPPEVVWIPVDPLRLKDRNEPARGLDAMWDGFGTCTHLSDVIPLAFHAHPPIDGAVSFSLLGEERQAVGVNGIELRLLPSIWGMRSNAGVGLMRQAIGISATSVASNDMHGRPETIE